MGLGPIVYYLPHLQNPKLRYDGMMAHRHLGVSDGGPVNSHWRGRFQP